jgi:glycosyltransferase involved in cell wall biosynthesis
MNKGKTPLVSVITSFLNEERFLEEAILSVIQQQFTDWELILMDDGSTDKSTQIAKEYSEKYPDKVIYLEHEGHANKSTAFSRNFAISKARGELIAFLDGDDIWLPAKLAKQVELMQKHPQVSMLFEASEYWYSWGDSKNKDIIIQVGNERDKVFSPPYLAETIYPLVPIAAPCPSAVMARKSSLIKLGGFVPEFSGRYQLYEDQAFLIKFYLNEPIYISSLCHNKYRQREGSCVQKANKGGYYHEIRKYFLEWLEKYLEENQIKNKNVKRLLNKALDQYNRPFIHQVRNRITSINKAVFGS